MLFAFQLRTHANARYQQSLLSLSHKELACMLDACGIPAQIEPRILGGAPFLCFDVPEINAAAMAFLARHSGLYMAAELRNGLLRPFDVPPRPSFLPADMPEILKYKGKTNADFTQLMINLALAAGRQWQVEKPRILDPICGRGTTLYCALIRGIDTIGIETDKKSLQEADAFTRKWLQYHKIKHSMQSSACTLPGGRNAPETVCRMTQGAQTLEMRTLLADTRDTGMLLRKRQVHALIADLPYGVQHAPKERGCIGGFEKLLADALPAWRQALLPGCAAAIAFNTYTIKRETLEKLALRAGFTLPESPLYADFSHWVEQAVNRDVLIALNTAK